MQSQRGDRSRELWAPSLAFGVPCACHKPAETTSAFIAGHLCRANLLLPADISVFVLSWIHVFRATVLLCFVYTDQSAFVSGCLRWQREVCARRVPSVGKFFSFNKPDVG